MLFFGVSLKVRFVSVGSLPLSGRVGGFCCCRLVLQTGLTSYDSLVELGVLSLCKKVCVSISALPVVDSGFGVIEDCLLREKVRGRGGRLIIYILYLGHDVGSGGLAILVSRVVVGGIASAGAMLVFGGVTSGLLFRRVFSPVNRVGVGGSLVGVYSSGFGGNFVNGGVLNYRMGSGIVGVVVERVGGECGCLRGGSLVFGGTSMFSNSCLTELTGCEGRVFSSCVSQEIARVLANPKLFVRILLKLICALPSIRGVSLRGVDGFLLSGGLNLILGKRAVGAPRDGCGKKWVFGFDIGCCMW